jgi:hypothetical protein
MEHLGGLKWAPLSAGDDGVDDLRGRIARGEEPEHRAEHRAKLLGLHRLDGDMMNTGSIEQRIEQSDPFKGARRPDDEESSGERCLHIRRREQGAQPLERELVGPLQIIEHEHDLAVREELTEQPIEPTKQREP